MELKQEALYCRLCQRDITREMKIYPFGYRQGAYCYDCAEKVKPAVKSKKSKQKAKAASKGTKSLTEECKGLYKNGMKPTGIARYLGIPTAEVYERLNDEKHNY